MNEPPKISVLMSVYNTDKKFLSKAIESVLNQTFSDFEFVIVLDCPTDGSDLIVETYASNDDRIKIIRNIVNLGLTKSLNKGLKKCKGKYIARMDADDISLSNRLELQFNYMEAHPNVAVVGTRTITPGTLKTTQSNCNGNREVMRIRMLFSNCGVPHPTAMIRSSFLRQYDIEYNEIFLKSQDYKLWCDILDFGNISILPQILLVYRVHENQISVGDPHRKNTYSLSISKHNCEQLLDRELSELELDLIRTMHTADFISCDVKDLATFFEKIVDANNLKRKYNTTLLYRELCYIWILKALRYFKKEKKLKMLYSKYFRVWDISILSYFLKNIHDILNYKKAVKAFVLEEGIL